MSRAIPSGVDLDTLGLETEPGKKIAWTLQNYGAYQVEGVPWARMMIAAEEGPAGNVPVDFKEDWGYDFVTTDKVNNPFFRDMIKLMPYMHIVSNNTPESVGGGGTPRQLWLLHLFDNAVEVETPLRRPISERLIRQQPGNIIPEGW